MLGYYIDHRIDVITRRTKFDLAKAEARAHILEGLRIALENLDRIIKTIKESDSPAAAKDALVKKFKMSELQAQAILDMKLHQLTGPAGYVFHSTRTRERPISDMTMNAAMRRMGIDTKTEITGHGFRAVARTILDEVLGFRPELIEYQLAHAVRDPLGRAYNRTAHLPDRRQMMQTWADYLDALKTGAKIIPLRSVEG